MPFDNYGRTASDQQGAVSGELPAGGNAFAPFYAIRKAIAASDQDTTLWGTAGSPAKCRILDAFMDVDTANAAETLTLRTASGGGGSALSSALSLAATGRIREATAPAVRTLSAGGNVFLRRNTTVGVGDVVVFIQYEL